VHTFCGRRALYNVILAREQDPAGPGPGPFRLGRRLMT